MDALLARQIHSIRHQTGRSATDLRSAYGAQPQIHSAEFVSRSPQNGDGGDSRPRGGRWRAPESQPPQ